MIVIREDAPEGLLVMEAVGKVTRSDYQDILIPELERAFAHGVRVRFLYILGEKFTGFEPKALLDDAKIGIKHFGDFERIAVVCDLRWIQQVVRLIGLITPCPVKTFHLDEQDVAYHWLQS